MTRKKKRKPIRKSSSRTRPTPNKSGERRIIKVRPHPRIVGNNKGCRFIDARLTRLSDSASHLFEYLDRPRRTSEELDYAYTKLAAIEHEIRTYRISLLTAI